MNQTTELVKKIFYPDPYTEIVEGIGDTVLHLSRNSIGNCKYILLVSSIDEETDLQALIKGQKELLKKYYNARISKGVGVIEIFIGKDSVWEAKVNCVKPDWHGLQSVIFQGFLFVDPDTQKHVLLQSQWGPIKFGNFQGQMDKVHYFLGQLGA